MEKQRAMSNHLAEQYQEKENEFAQIIGEVRAIHSFGICRYYFTISCSTVIIQWTKIHGKDSR